MLATGWLWADPSVILGLCKGSFKVKGALSGSLGSPQHYKMLLAYALLNA